MKKKMISVLLTAVMVMSLVACGNSEKAEAPAEEAVKEEAAESETPEESEEAPVTLVVGNAATGETNPYNMAMNWAQEWLEENNSSITLNLQLQGVMGSETEQAQQVVLGNQDICQIADMSYTNIAPKMAFSNFPMLLDGYDEVREGWGQGGWMYELADDILSEAGLKVLAAGDNGFRMITNSKRPIEKFEDMAGLKMRVPENKLLLAIWEKFGCQTAPIAFGELTAALQQKIVDGQENGIQHCYSNRWDEFNQYVTQINYDFSAFICSINLDKYNSLSEKQQEDLLAAFNYGCEKAIDYCAEFTSNGMEEMKADGLIESEMTDEFKDKIYAVGYEIAHEQEWMDLLGEDLVNEMYPSETRSK